MTTKNKNSKSKNKYKMKNNNRVYNLLILREEFQIPNKE